MEPERESITLESITQEQRAASPLLRPSGSLRSMLARHRAYWKHQRRAQFGLQRPIVSFTFDDILESAATEGARLLEEHGARGTFFVSCSFTGKQGMFGKFATSRQIASLAERNHEIACHTWSHLNCGVASADRIAEDCERNRAQLREMGIATVNSFSYPFGELSAAAKPVLGARFQVCRALQHGLVESGTDLNQAPSVGIEGEHGEIKATRWLHQAAAQRAWLILYTHDVRDECSPYGCTPAALQRLLATADLLDFQVLTVAEAARQIAVA